MATSGLLLAAKDKDTHAELQKQFESRSVKKRYIALLDGIPSVEPKGFIRLPMRPDFDNRPLQMVDFECGKAAVTRYEILSPTIMQSKAKDLSNITPCTSKILRHKAPLNDTAIVYTRIAYYPETGRTHQLRVHSAHPNGMNCPIVGDPLYGQVAERLYLHAEQLEFRHPQDGHILRIQKDPLF
jgi:tRNA pseudouridine32 synthase/23S rRNA pseudouridine746 synthase